MKTTLIRKFFVISKVFLALILILSLLLIWFVAGVFPIYPSVIVTGSMRPMIYEGDITVIKKVRKEQEIDGLKVGDVIEFKRGDLLVTHRIIKVIKDELGNLSFQTKGDNNSSKDSREVLPKEVRGTVVKVIPKVGLPTFWIRSGGRKIPEL